MSVRKRSWKVAAVAALVCTGVVAAAVVGVKIIKYHYMDYTFDVNPTGHHRVISEDGKNMMMLGGSHVDDPEQAVEYAEEIALLKQQGNRKLVLVTEIEVNGQHDSRLFTYKYNLSDGRTIRAGERDPDDDGPGTLVGERLKEAGQLLRETIEGEKLEMKTDGQSVSRRHLTAEGEEIETYEQVVQGRVFSFTTRRFVLSDGTEVVWSIGVPKDDQ